MVRLPPNGEPSTASQKVCLPPEEPFDWNRSTGDFWLEPSADPMQPYCNEVWARMCLLLQRRGQAHDVVHVAAQQAALVPLLEGELVADLLVIPRQLGEILDEVALGHQHR